MENHFLDITLKIARDAGALLMEYYGKLDSRQIFSKGVRDQVTEADLQCEKQIVAQLTKHFPDHSILAEEQTNKKGSAPYQWFVDPLDGTNNFAHHHPFFAVSIGVAHQGNLIAGVVYAPYLRELYYALKDGGAYLETDGSDKRQLRISPTEDFDQSLLACGFAYKRMKDVPDIDRFFFPILNAAQGIRRCGAASLDLCYVAAGRYDGFWEWGLHPHDIAAGALIVREAGGTVTNWDGANDCLWEKHVVASNGKLHQELLAKVDYHQI